MAHDQLFKELLRAFFREFVELFFPDVAEHLDFARVTFLDREMFTDLPEGSVREPDLVAQTFTRDGTPELVLLHVEVQSERRADVRYRVFEYYALLRLRFKLPVFPVVLYLAPGTGGSTQETYTESLFGRDILTFHYGAVGVPDLDADDYLERDNPLASALTALMKASKEGRPYQKQVSLQRIATSGVDDARKMLLANIVETYLPLSAAEQEQFAALLAQPGTEETRQMISVYEERGIAKGLQQGLQEGIVGGKRDTLLRLLRVKFGALPPSVEAQVQAIADEAQLDTLSERVLTANSLQDMGLKAE